jgi:hypothetical protein
VRRAMPRMVLEQPRNGMHQERQDRAVGFGDVQRALQGAAGGTGVAQRVPRGRLQQQSLTQRGPMGDGG